MATIRITTSINEEWLIKAEKSMLGGNYALITVQNDDYSEEIIFSSTEWPSIKKAVEEAIKEALK